MKKILVTGAAGFLGSHLCQKLSSNGHEVVGVDNMTGGYSDNVPKNITFHAYDCCDLEKMHDVMKKGVDIVYHCAATAHEGLSVFSPVEITKNVYLALKEQYLPKGPLDLCPKNDLSYILSLSDKLDTLLGFFLIAEIPSASKDPYALRRAALGILRIIIENNLKIIELPVTFKQRIGYSKSQSDKKGKAILYGLRFIWLILTK